jgi:LacI family transcriptional regulator
LAKATNEGRKRRRRPGKTAEAGQLAVTVNDVASLARTSTATVSRALNLPEAVSEDVRERVFAAVQKLGYIPNNSARALRQNQTRLIGVVVPTLKYALYATFYEGLQASLTSMGFFAVLTTSDYDLEVEAEQIRKLVQRGAQGLVLVGKTRDRKLTDFLARARVPYVSTYVFDPTDNENIVGFDNVRAIAGAVDYLVSLGHRDIVMLSGITSNRNDRAQARVKGFLDAAQTHKLPVEKRVAEAPYSIEGGRAALREIFDRGVEPTGIVCGSDMLALGAIQECRARGLKIPRDLSIIGFDDLDFAAHLDPPLSTVEVPSWNLGHTAGDYIVALCTGAKAPTVTNLPTRLLIRNTTGKPRNVVSLKRTG